MSWFPAPKVNWVSWKTMSHLYPPLRTVLKDRVIVICDKTRQIERINVDRLNKDIPVLEEKIANLSETSIVSRSLLTRKLRWCKVQLAAKEKEDLYK